jgi:hypothetical protein
MNYFTPDLIQRGNSLDDDVADAASEEWEKAIRRYQRRWDKIKAAFPEEVRRFDDEAVCLHDAYVLSIARQGETLVMVLQAGPPSRNAVVLTFTLLDDPEIETVLPDRPQHGPVLWMYEEFDLDRRKRCTFEVLLTNGWSVKVRFRDFHFLVAERLFPVPAAKVDVPVLPPTPVPQSA